MKFLGKVWLMACLVLLAAVGAAFAQGKIIFYDNFFFGMNWEVAASFPRTETCPDGDPADVLCADQALFSGQRWDRLFFFSERKLARVVLFSENIENHFAAALRYMDKNNFSLVALTNAQDDTLDIVAVQQGKSQEELLAAVNEFEKSAIETSRIMYTFFDTASRPADLGGKDGWADWADGAPDSLRMAQVELSLPNYVRVTFSAPKAQMP